MVMLVAGHCIMRAVRWVTPACIVASAEYFPARDDFPLRNLTRTHSTSERDLHQNAPRQSYPPPPPYV